jgi:dihydrodipicolinate synthase/N-acetylneuraminate lyase
MSPGFSVHAALTTPFSEGGALDLEALRAHVELLVEDGLDGVVVAGTTGEGPLLEEAEVEAAVAAAVEASADRIEVIAHVGRASTLATTRLAPAAAAAGADALIAVTPYYFELGDDQLLRHYETLLGAAGGMPVLAYTFPDRTGNELTPEVLDRLAGEGLAGLKDSTKSPDRHREYLEVRRRHPDLRVMVGAERLALQSLRGGGAGSISALANVRADVLLGLRDEPSDRAQDAVDSAREPIPDIPSVKRAVSERLAARGIPYPSAPRAPLAG